MGIDKVKYFVHRDDSTGAVVYAKDIESMQTIEDYDIGLFGVIETKEGDVLFEIEWNYFGELIVMRKFMHLKSYLKFYRYSEMKFLDRHAERYIKSYLRYVIGK